MGGSVSLAVSVNVPQMLDLIFILLKAACLCNTDRYIIIFIGYTSVAKATRPKVDGGVLIPALLSMISKRIIASYLD